MFLGFCCWLTPITPTVLCVSTCSDGLLDFHRRDAIKERDDSIPPSVFVVKRVADTFVGVSVCFLVFVAG